MITEATVTLAADGGVLLTLPKTGMDLARETAVSVEGRKLLVRQGATVFVSLDINGQVKAAIRRAAGLTVVEVDEAGFDFHQKVRKV